MQFAVTVNVATLTLLYHSAVFQVPSGHQ